MTVQQNGHERGLPTLAGGCVITVGTFDGVHRGHQDLLQRLSVRARQMGRPAVVVTFDPHPLEVLRPDIAPPLLTLHHEKLEQFVQHGVSHVVVLPFTKALAAFEAATFVDDVLRNRLALAELLVGHDHGFGRGRLGDIEVLRALAETRAFSITELPPVVGRDGEAISSTVIRRAIAAGDLDTAADGLGRRYSVSGRVVKGDQRGRLLGYPTLNLAPLPDRKLLPPDGVYAVLVQTPQGPFRGMLNLGPRPTVGDHVRRIETHVFDANIDWYGATIRLDFVARIRDTVAFPGLDALKQQLALDARNARSELASILHGGELPQGLNRA